MICLIIINKNHINNKIETIYTKFIWYWLKELSCTGCNIAYINLNKRGGFGSTNHARLKHYVNEYKCYISKEIEIINPDIIVCGGTYGIVNALNIKCHEIRNDYHPSARRHASWHWIKLRENMSKSLCCHQTITEFNHKVYFSNFIHIFISDVAFYN